MKRYLTFFFLLITSIALCAYPEGAINNIDGSALGWDNASQTWRPIAVDGNGKLGTGDSQVVASISVDTSNIENNLKVDDVSVAELVNGIGTDTKNIEGNLKIDNKTITDLVNGIGTDTNVISNDVETIKTDVSRIAKGSQPNRLYMNRLSVSANSHYQILPLGSSAIDNGRVFVELRAIDPDAEFYIGLDAMVTDLTGRPVKGRILINISADQDLYIYHTNESALAIQQTEGWN